MFSNAQLAKALPDAPSVTCAVALSAEPSPSQRCLFLATRGHHHHHHHSHLGVVALGRFQLQKGSVACDELQTVPCSKELTWDTVVEENTIKVSFYGASQTLSCLVPLAQEHACTTLLVQLKHQKDFAIQHDISEDSILRWSDTLQASVRSISLQAAARQSVKASQINILLDKRRHEFVTHEHFNLLITSWNVNGHLLTAEDDLAPWLIQASDADLVVMGFQELDLSAEALIRYTPDRALAWEQHLRTALAKFGEFQLVTSKQLVGLFIVVFARTEFRQHTSYVHATSVATGPLGFANKGAVSVSMRVHESELCFVSAHLAAGEDGVEYRNSDLRAIFQKTSFHHDRESVDRTSLGLIPNIPASLGRQLPYSSLFRADHVILMGDINYRSTLPNDKVRRLVTQNDFKTLLRHDQLEPVLTSGILKGFQEAEIDWPPTYKFDKQSIEYDTSEKQRTPSYTDRILWMNALPLQPRSYRAHFEFGQSDHKPISAVLQVSVEKTDPGRKLQAQQSVLEALDQEENAQRPTAVLSNPVLDFPPLELDQPAVRDTTLANTGQVAAKWHLTSREVKPWLRIEPQSGSLEPGDSATIHVTAHVHIDLAAKLNSGEWTMEPELLVLSVEEGPDLFATVSTLEWQATFLTMPLDALVRTPEAVGKLSTEERRACFTDGRSPLRQLPWELTALTSFLVEHGINDPDLFTLPSQRAIQRLAKVGLDSGEGLHMDALLARSALLSLNSVSSLLGQRPSADDDVLDLSDETNMLELDEHAAVQAEHAEDHNKSRLQVTRAVAALLLEMLDLLPEPIIPRQLHEQVMAADLTNLKLEQAYQVLARLPKTSAAVFMHLCGFLKAYLQSASSSEAERQRLTEQVAVAFSAVMVKPALSTSPVAGSSAKRRAFVRAFIQ